MFGTGLGITLPMPGRYREGVGKGRGKREGLVLNNKTFQEELKLIWEGELSSNLTRCYVFFILHVNECSACTEILFCI